MQHAAHRDRVGQQPCNLPHCPLVVDSIELSRVHEGIPVRQVDLRLVHCGRWIFEFGKEAPRDQVVIILVDFPELVANLKMCFVVVGKMLFGARHRNATVGAFITNMGRGERACLSRFQVIGGGWCARRLVLWMGTVCVLLHDSRPLANSWRLRVGK